MPFQIGETVGPYRITEQLGQGGMATVYKAYHPSLDRYVAIKVLHPAFKEDESFYMRFQREAQVVAKLEHPNIVPVFDMATKGTEPYIVMKFIEGQTLKHRLRRNPLTLGETLDVIPAVAAALTYAHEQGYLHRDVKPSNVLLDNDNTPYLADFGLARIVSTGESTMSQDVLIGTPNYISPEQARGGKGLGPSTDIYSLGIMLYEIVVGRVPFSADTPYAVVHDHIYKPLPMPSKVNPTVPQQVETVLLKALAKDPNDRYETAVALAEAFKQSVAASEMNELSATSIRLEEFQVDTPVSTSKEELDAIIKQHIAEALPPDFKSASRVEAAIPGVMPSVTTTPTPFPYPQQHSPFDRRSFWVVTGIGALVFICILSLAVTLSALQNPIVQSNPALADAAEEEVVPTANVPDQTGQINVSLSMEEVQAWAQREPENPAAFLSMAVLYLDEGMTASAQESAAVAIDELNASGELLAEAARAAASEGYTNEAVVLWMAAFHREPDNPAIRNDAGQYIYRQMSNPAFSDITEIQSYVEQFPNSPFARTMVAQAMISAGRRAGELRTRQAANLLEQALSQNDTFAEAHLVYGNLYEAEDDIESAIEAWRFAASFTNSPEWVQREANLKLDNYSSQEN
jgi:serine/threonine-protein kinase